VIDYVEYTDQNPGPDADGNGDYLKLTSTDLDNSLAESWTASNDLITSIEVPYEPVTVAIFPNPFRETLYISSESVITSVEIYDINGRLVLSQPCGSESCQVHAGRLAAGTYIIRVTTGDRYYTDKIVKRQ
jgi:hypothetical protein